VCIYALEDLYVCLDDAGVHKGTNRKES